MRCQPFIVLLLLVFLLAACGRSSNTSISSSTNVNNGNDNTSQSLPGKLEELEKLPGGRSISVLNTDLNEKFEVQNNLGTPATFPVVFNKKGLNFVVYRLFGITKQQAPTSIKATFTGSQSKLWFALFNKEQKTWNWYYTSGSNTVPFQLTSNKAFTLPTAIGPNYRTDEILDKDGTTVKINEGRMYIAIIANLEDGETLNISKLNVTFSNNSAFAADVAYDPDPIVVNKPVTFTVTCSGGVKGIYDITYDFGDGTAPVAKKAIKGTDSAAYTYKEEKTYKFKVTITDPYEPLIQPFEYTKDIVVNPEKTMDWDATAGNVEFDKETLTATFDTAGLDPGKYKITATMTGGNIEFGSQSKAVFGPSDKREVVTMTVKETTAKSSNSVDFWVYILPQDKIGKLIKVIPAPLFYDRAYSIRADTPTKAFKDYIDQKCVITLNFWEYNCGPCLSEFPHMTATAVKNKNNRYMHIGVTGGGLYWGSTFQTFAEVNNWLDSNGSPYKYGPSWTDNFYDPNTDADRTGGFAKRDTAQKYTKASTGGAIAWEGNSYPRSFLIDPDGNIRGEASTMDATNWDIWMSFASLMMPDYVK